MAKKSFPKPRGYAQFVSGSHKKAAAFKFPNPPKVHSKPISSKILRKIFKWLKKKPKKY